MAVDSFNVPNIGAVAMGPKSYRARKVDVAVPAIEYGQRRLRRFSVEVIDERPAVAIISIDVLSDISIRVNFNRGARDNEALSAAENYVISPSLEVLAAEPEAVASPSFVVLTVREMVDGEAYTLAIKRVDPDANLADITAAFIGQGTLPTFVSVTTPAERTVRVSFSEPMDPSSGVLDLGSYTLTAGAGAVACAITEVRPDDPDAPSFVDLVLDGEMTIGTENYELAVDSGFTDVAGNTITGTLTRAFDGRGTRPRIIDAQADESALEKLRLTFSEPVKQVSAGNGDDALNPSNYAITGPSTVEILSVASLSSSMVELTVRGQRAGLGKYRVTVTAIEDLANNAVEV